jgi:His/Glu/Gln/Arg/opine family amino acid ABC transporter permease subunit
MQDLTILQQIIRLGQGFLLNLTFLPFVLLIGVFLGMLIALARFHKIPVLSQILGVLVEIVRGSPFLLIVYSVFFILPYVGIDFDAFTTGIIVLSITAVAYLSEIFRSGLSSLDKGQFESSDALGFTYFQKLRLIILPQVIKMTIPSIIGQIVMTIKDTSILSLVGYTEVLRTSRQVMQLTLEPFTAFAIASGYFILICYPLIVISKRFERRTKKA